MNWKGCQTKRLWPILQYFSGIGLDRPRKTKKTAFNTVGLWTEIWIRSWIQSRDANQSTDTFDDWNIKKLKNTDTEKSSLALTKTQ
jgi:hypothetical protein